MSSTYVTQATPHYISPLSALAIAQLSTFGILLFLVIFVLGRDASISTIYHTHRAAPYAWIPLIIFLINGIIGASLQLTTIDNPDPLTSAIGAATSFTIGFPLLLIAVVEVTIRINQHAAHRRYDDRIVVAASRILQVILIIAVHLYIVGGVRSGNVYRNTYERVFPTSGKLDEAATIISVIGLAVFVVGQLGFVAVTNFNRGFIREKVLLFAVELSALLLIVRMVYAILEGIVGQRQANPIYGSIGLRVGLGYVMEVAVVIVLVAGGWVNLAYRRQRYRSRRHRGSSGTGSSRRNTIRSSSRGTRTVSEETDMYEVVR